MDNERNIHEEVDSLLKNYPSVRENNRTRSIFQSITPELVKEDAIFMKLVEEGALATREEKYISYCDLKVGDIIRADTDLADLRINSRKYPDVNHFGKIFHKTTRRTGMRCCRRLSMRVTEVTEDYIKTESIGVCRKGVDVKFFAQDASEHPHKFKVIPKRSYRDQEIKFLTELIKLIREHLDDIEQKANKIRDIAESIYPGMVDLIAIQDNLTPMMEKMFRYGNFHALLIRFPEIQITNKKSEVHLMEEMYICIPICMDGSCGYMKGVRAKLEAKEIKTNYGHSHMSGGHFEFTGFCLGKGSFSTNMNILKTEYNEELWEITLTQLKYYLEWESISGGPFRRIEKAISGGVGNSHYMSSGNVSDICKELINVIPEDVIDNIIKIKIHDSGENSTQIEISGTKEIARYIEQYEGDTYHISLEALHKAYVNISSDNRRIGNLPIEEARKIVANRRRNSDYINFWKGSDGGFFFKGEKITQELHVDEDLYDDSYKTSIVDLHPSLKKEVVCRIQNKFMNHISSQVLESEKQNNKYNEYKKQIEEFPEEILTSTSVF